MKSGAITLQGLNIFAKSLNGMLLHTGARRHKFRFYVDEHGFNYIPESTQKLRTHDNPYIERVLERFNQIGSLHPGDYSDITVNASYLLAVIEKYLDAAAVAG